MCARGLRSAPPAAALHRPRAESALVLEPLVPRVLPDLCEPVRVVGHDPLVRRVVALLPPRLAVEDLARDHTMPVRLMIGCSDLKRMPSPCFTPAGSTTSTRTPRSVVIAHTSPS